MDDYYRRLELKSTAGFAEIKKAYRKLARLHHPDRNQNQPGSEENFKLLQAAYHVLSDTARRKEYDTLCQKSSAPPDYPPRQAGGHSYESIEYDPSDPYHPANFQSVHIPFAQPQPARGEDAYSDVSLSFQQSMEGVQVACETLQEQECPACNNLPSARVTCLSCHGVGSQEVEQIFQATIPAGVRDGDQRRLKGKGSPGKYGGPPGDLCIQIQVTPSSYFRRQGDDLEIDVPITLQEALWGGTIEVPSPWGIHRIRISAKAAHGSLQRLRGKGAPIARGKGSRGDLYCRLVLQIPTLTTPEQQQIAMLLTDSIDQENPRTSLIDNILSSGESSESH